MQILPIGAGTDLVLDGRLTVSQDCDAGAAAHRRTEPAGTNSATCDTLLFGHERQRQAPACWPATLQPRWGAPGDDQVEQPTPVPRQARGRQNGPPEATG